MDDNLLGLKIKQLRSDYGFKTGKKFTQQSLAEKLGISRSYLSDIESGRTKPNMNLLGKIADAFDIDIQEILDGNNTNFEVDNTPTKEELSKEKISSIITKIDGDAAIKSWLKNTNLKTALLELIQNNADPLLNDFRNNIKTVALSESTNFKKINGLKSDQYSLQANILEMKYSNNFYDFFLDKILSLIQLENEKIKNNANEIPLAAHNDFSNDFEQQQLMKEDLDEL